MSRWIEVARVEEISPGNGRTVAVGERRLALFNDGGEFLAIDDVCPHQGASLGTGSLHGGRVICPLHSWVFDLRTGRCPRDTHEPVEVFPVRCDDGAVLVELPQESAGESA